MWKERPVHAQTHSLHMKYYLTCPETKNGKIYCLQHILTRFYEDQEKKCGWRCLFDSKVNHVNEKKSNLETNILSLQTLIGLSKDDILFDSQEY